jgi:hypothetical protein
MNTETRDYLKIGLLGVIAVCLVYGTFFKTKKSSRRSLKNTAVAESSSFPQAPEQNDLSVAIDPNKAEGSSHNYGSTTVSWDKETHNFGNIKQHSTNDHVFTFTNTGDQPLVIEDAQGSCGCTVPEYPKEPVMPGQTGEIKVKYSPGTQIGNQTKSVTITTNAEPKVHTLYINAVVEEAPDPLLQDGE